MIVARVQRRYVVKGLSTRFQKQFCILHRDLLERLETIGGKAGADDIETVQALPAEFDNGLVRVGAQPLFTAYAGLKRQNPFIVAQLKRGGDKARRRGTG